MEKAAIKKVGINYLIVFGVSVLSFLLQYLPIKVLHFIDYPIVNALTLKFVLLFNLLFYAYYNKKIDMDSFRKVLAKQIILLLALTLIIIVVSLMIDKGNIQSPEFPVYDKYRIHFILTVCSYLNYYLIYTWLFTILNSKVNLNSSLS